MSEDITKQALQSALNFEDKVDKVTRKGSSSNDFTNAVKSKLDSVTDTWVENIIQNTIGSSSGESIKIMEGVSLADMQPTLNTLISNGHNIIDIH